jgi:hypothetical protein
LTMPAAVQVAVTFAACAAQVTACAINLSMSAGAAIAPHTCLCRQHSMMQLLRRYWLVPSI